MTESVSRGVPFRILATLGQGGFGTVYKAETQDENRRVVALKMLHPEQVDGSEMLSRLREEARILGLVRHRAILRAEGIVQLRGRWSLVMEHVPGATLKQCVAHAGALPIPAALAIVQEIADALYVAYNTPGPDGQAMRILHRDIKPSNIQITPGGQVRLLDFGIARAHDATSSGQTTSRGFGSWEYVAPERLDGVDSPAGDVYALGTVLFEALAGQPLGRASGNPVRHQQRVSEGMAAIREAAAGLDESWLATLQAMLAYDPEERPRIGELRDSANSPLPSAQADALAAWASVVAPASVDGSATARSDLAPGDIVFEGMEIDEEEDVSDQPSIAPAFGLPETALEEILEEVAQPSDAPAVPASQTLAQRLFAVSTRDLTPPGTRARAVWGVVSLILFLATLVGLGWLVWMLR